VRRVVLPVGADSKCPDSTRLEINNDSPDRQLPGTDTDDSIAGAHRLTDPPTPTHTHTHIDICVVMTVAHGRSQNEVQRRPGTYTDFMYIR